MKKIKYICYYADPQKHPNRNFVLAATNKITYICNAVNNCGCEVELISASGSKIFEKGEIFKVSEHTSLRLFKSFGTGYKVKRVISRYIFMLRYFCYLLMNIKKNDTVIVYHSLGYMKLISFLRKIKKFNLVLEIEEIYSDVIGNKKLRKKELEFFKLADKYIFPTELMDDSINIYKKPSIIIYGTYQVENDRNVSFDDDKIHIVYAGTLDPRKGGATTTTTTAYLTENYHVHILGFGSKQDIDDIKKLIADTMTKSKATVTYDGVKSGEEYIEFLQKCHIGLSTQNPDAEFNDTSFPSKILSYMANGLRVVSVDIPAIKRAKISEHIYFYSEQKPEKIAEAIMGIDFNKNYDSRKLIKELDNEFIEKLGEMFNA